MPSATILLEVCVDSAAGLAAAVAGGADRIELCSALVVGGLTPSAGLMAIAASSPCPTRAMIRPRAGTFVYSSAELDVMRRDIDAARAAGLAGIVIGASHHSGSPDAEVLAMLVRHASGMQVALHRAVDLAPDLLAALELAMALGVDTVQTSGGRATALEGAANIAALQARAGRSVELLAAAGIRPENVLRLIAQSGVKAVHGSCSTPSPQADKRAVDFGFAPAAARDTDLATVRRMKATLAQLS
jgi:copper homeostasis protein